MITAQQLFDKVIEIAKRYPDAKYDDSNGYSYCKNVPIGGPKTPGCIIGQALRELDPAMLEAIETKLNPEGHPMDTTKWTTLCRTMGWDDLDDNRLAVIQERQDSGRSWGEAIRGY